MNREQEKRRLRAGAFMVNNGRVLMTINLLREKYNALRSVEKGLKAEGIERQEFIDSVNFLHEEGYIYLRDMESREPANLADVEYQDVQEDKEVFSGTQHTYSKALEWLYYLVNGEWAPVAASRMKWLIWTADGTGA